VALGFFVVFAALGIPINAGVTSIYEWMPWLTIVIGALLGVLGASMLLGWKPVFLIPRLEKGGRSRRFGSMLLYGVSYAVASLGCTLPVFLVVVAGTAERSNAASGALAFIAYGLGTTLVLMIVSIAIALTRDGLVRKVRELARFVDRASGVLLLAVGGYLIWYGVYATDPANGTASSPFKWVERWSSDATRWLSDGGTALGITLAVIVAATAFISLRLRRP
jgi:cytochrome c biogenesis protein CcdA